MNPRVGAQLGATPEGFLGNIIQACIVVYVAELTQTTSELGASVIARLNVEIDSIFRPCSASIPAEIDKPFRQIRVCPVRRADRDSASQPTPVAVPEWQRQ